jgi:hypothetical protein
MAMTETPPRSVARKPGRETSAGTAERADIRPDREGCVMLAPFNAPGEA